MTVVAGPAPFQQPDAHDPGDPGDETCRCGRPRFRDAHLWWCARCDEHPRPDPEARPPGGPHA